MSTCGCLPGEETPSLALCFQQVTGRSTFTSCVWPCGAEVTNKVAQLRQRERLRSNCMLVLMMLVALNIYLPSLCVVLPALVLHQYLWTTCKTRRPQFMHTVFQKHDNAAIITFMCIIYNAQALSCLPRAMTDDGRGQSSPVVFMPA